MRPLTILDALAILLILAIFAGGILGTLLRKPRNDASRERANADRPNGAAPVSNTPVHAATTATEGQ